MVKVIEATDLFISKLIVIVPTRIGAKTLNCPEGQRTMFYVETKNLVKNGYALISIEIIGSFPNQLNDFFITGEKSSSVLVYPNDEKVKTWDLPNEKEVSEFRKTIRMLSNESPDFSIEAERILNFTKNKKGV